MRGGRELLAGTASDHTSCCWTAHDQTYRSQTYHSQTSPGRTSLGQTTHDQTYHSQASLGQTSHGWPHRDRVFDDWKVLGLKADGQSIFCQNDYVSLTDVDQSGGWTSDAWTRGAWTSHGGILHGSGEYDRADGMTAVVQACDAGLPRSLSRCH